MEFIQFLCVALGSLAELENQIELSSRLTWSPESPLNGRVFYCILEYNYQPNPLRHDQGSLAEKPLTLEDKCRILEALHQEARRLGHFREADFLVGLDDVVRLVAALSVNVSGPPR
jgi:hypothetical protein